MPSSPLLVDSQSLTNTSVDMGVVAEQLTELKKLIDQQCHLPSLALGVVGGLACARYNGDCDTAGSAANALCAEADTMVDALGRSAVGYVSAGDANLQAIEQAAEAAHSATAAVGGDPALVAMPASWLSRSGAMLALQSKTNAASSAAQAMSDQLERTREATAAAQG